MGHASGLVYQFREDLDDPINTSLIAQRPKAHPTRQADCGRDVLRSRTTAALLRAAVEERLERGPAACVERAASLRCADLVARERERIEWHLAGIDVHLAERLHRVRMEERILGLRG